MRTRRRPPRGSLLLLLLIAFVAHRMWTSREASRQGDDRAPRENDEAIDARLVPSSPLTVSPGIAALIVMDVSGSMDDPVAGADGRLSVKIEVARRAAVNLVRQFDRYARAHPAERVVVGLSEFSARPGGPSYRQVLAPGRPDVAAAERAVERMRANGGTPIGDAMVDAKRALDATGLDRRHLLVVTDGENTDGVEPGQVAHRIAARPEAERPSIYFVAFDVDAARFAAVRDAGGLVLAASNERELTETLDYLLTGKILVEPPSRPK